MGCAPQKNYAQFKNDVNHYVIAYEGRLYNTDESINEELRKVWDGRYNFRKGVHIKYDKLQEMNHYKEYIEKWGEEEFARNLARVGREKYRDLFNEEFEYDNFDQSIIDDIKIYQTFSDGMRSYYQGGGHNE